MRCRELRLLCRAIPIFRCYAYYFPRTIAFHGYAALAVSPAAVGRSET